MEVNEVTIPSPDFPGGQTFGPVTLENPWEAPVNLTGELPVTYVPHRVRLFAIDWYREICRTRGVFGVTANRITLTPTAPILIERAARWRRCGYWLFTRSSRINTTSAEARRHVSRT